MAHDEQETPEIALEAIPLVVVSENETAPERARRGLKIPKIVDYLVVATFMYFVL